MSEVRLHVQDLDGFFGSAKAAAATIDAGVENPATAEITFETADVLLKVLTPNRWRLLRALRTSGSSSVRALAKVLGRDYSGVHADVRTLSEAGLIARDEDGAVLVPWSRITAEMVLDEAA